MQPPEERSLDPVMARLAPLVGGVWTNDDPKFVVENRFPGRLTTRSFWDEHLGKGTAELTATYLGWDGAKRLLRRCHRGNEVLKDCGLRD